jgi:hypothetical protein
LVVVPQEEKHGNRMVLGPMNTAAKRKANFP